jgi:hypothetical protein
MKRRIPRGQEKFLAIIDLKGWGYANCDVRAYIAAIEIMQVCLSVVSCNSTILHSVSWLTKQKLACTIRQQKQLSEDDPFLFITAPSELLPGAARQGADDQRALHLHEGVEDDDLPVHRHQHQGQGETAFHIRRSTAALAASAAATWVNKNRRGNCNPFAQCLCSSFSWTTRACTRRCAGRSTRPSSPSSLAARCLCSPSRTTMPSSLNRFSHYHYTSVISISG